MNTVRPVFNEVQCLVFDLGQLALDADGSWNDETAGGHIFSLQPSSGIGKWSQKVTQLTENCVVDRLEADCCSSFCCYSSHKSWMAFFHLYNYIQHRMCAAPTC